MSLSGIHVVFIRRQRQTWVPVATGMARNMEVFRETRLYLK